jgi:hypothetical protein
MIPKRPIRLTSFAVHRALPPSSRILPLLVTHGRHPPSRRFPNRLVILLDLLILDIPIKGSGDVFFRVLDEGMRSVDVTFGLLSDGTPVPGSRSFFGERLVQTGLGDCWVSMGVGDDR